MVSAKDLREVVAAARPLIEEWLDIAEQIAALRTLATEKGLDWSQIKALIKAQVQDERAGDSKRVQRIIEKAEFASAYAGMLGLAKMNENNFFGEDAPPAATLPHDPETGEVEEPADTAAAVAPVEPRSPIAMNLPITGERVEYLGARAQRGSGTPPAAAEPFTPPAFLSGERPALRPNCLNPDNCSGYGRNHCHTCGKAAEKTEAA